MASERASDSRWPRWSVLLPFLMLAYPFTGFLYLGGRYCGPLCFAPTPRDVATLLAGLLVLLVIASGVAAALALEGRAGERTVVRWLVSPSPLAGGILLGLFGAFIAFLTLDVLALYEGIWKPLVLPVSFVLFLPVWVLYAASFPLAVLFSAAGIESSPVVTLVFRGIVLFLGFPLVGVWQTLGVSMVVDSVRTGPG